MEKPSIPQYIRSIRRKLSLTQEQLATEVGSTRANIANYETGRAIPPADVFLRIQSTCGENLCVPDAQPVVN